MGQDSWCLGAATGCQVWWYFESVDFGDNAWKYFNDEHRNTLVTIWDACMSDDIDLKRKAVEANLDHKSKTEVNKFFQSKKDPQLQDVLTLRAKSTSLERYLNQQKVEDYFRGGVSNPKSIRNFVAKTILVTIYDEINEGYRPEAIHNVITKIAI